MQTTRLARFVGSAVILLGAASASAQTTTLYDPSLGTFPDQQGWGYLTNPLVGSGVVRSFDTSAGLAVLDTSAARGDQAGYFSHNPLTGTRLPNFPELPDGTRLGFTLDLRGEGHNARDDNGDGLDDRAGFSVIAIRDDGRGIELAWWEDRIFAYEYDASGNRFLHGESAAPFAPRSTGAIDYELSLVGDGYELRYNDTLALSGPLRDYGGFGAPYTFDSFLFFGDDTGSADSVSGLGQITVTIPEPATAGGLLVLALALRRR